MNLLSLQLFVAGLALVIALVALGFAVHSWLHERTKR